jgi:hypothetical protein
MENEKAETSRRELSRCTWTATPAQTALEVLVFLGPSEVTPEASSSTPRGLQLVLRHLTDEAADGPEASSSIPRGLQLKVISVDDSFIVLP